MQEVGATLDASPTVQVEVGVLFIAAPRNHVGPYVVLWATHTFSSVAMPKLSRLPYGPTVAPAAFNSPRPHAIGIYKLDYPTVTLDLYLAA